MLVFVGLAVLAGSAALFALGFQRSNLYLVMLSGVVLVLAIVLMWSGVGHLEP